jgi:hypothetical protein
VTAEIVEDNDVAWSESWDEYLFDIGEEACAVDRSVDDTGSAEAVMSQGGKEGQRAPSAMWCLTNKSRPARRPAVSARHVCLGPSLIDEDQAGWINFALVLAPLTSPPSDVGTILFAGVQGFF